MNCDDHFDLVLVRFQFYDTNRIPSLRLELLNHVMRYIFRTLIIGTVFKKIEIIAKNFYFFLSWFELTIFVMM